MRIKLFKTGEVVKDGKIVSTTFAEMETETTKYCWLHPQVISSLDDRKHPTERDKKLLAKITFKGAKTTDKKGNVVFIRSCPKCHNTITIEPKALSRKPMLVRADEKISKELAQGNSNGQIL